MKIERGPLPDDQIQRVAEEVCCRSLLNPVKPKSVVNLQLLNEQVSIPKEETVIINPIIEIPNI